jgi:Protein of unknown function (DUF3617)
MRNLPIATLIAAPVVAIAFAALADTLPLNKPGLWISRTVQDGQTTETKLCMDHATQGQMMQMGMAMSKELCSSNAIKRTGNMVTVDSVCKLMGSTITSRAVYTYTGDTGYKGTINTSYSPPMMGKKADTMTVESKWAGACPAGMVAGDVILAGGMKMHIGKDGKPAFKQR